MELNLDRRKIKVKVSGKEYVVFFPTARQTEQFDLKYKELDKKKGDSYKLIFDFLESLGFPKDVSEQLDVFSLTELLEHLSGKKRSK